jgi:hypothetical protein
VMKICHKPGVTNLADVQTSERAIWPPSQEDYVTNPSLTCWSLGKCSTPKVKQVPLVGRTGVLERLTLSPGEYLISEV